MRNHQRQRVIFYIIIGLMIIGALSMVARNPSAVLLPLIVFGGVFLLYKYPPHTWKRMNAMSRNSRNSKKAKFRVIPGSGTGAASNKDDEDGNNLPKYH